MGQTVSNMVERKNVFQCLKKCLTSFKFYQTRSNTIKQGVQTGKCSVTKQCLIVFDR